ncbi:hypothetical protein F4803DRAFT_577320 [Xylaria telfairii]|nr:hypothetical protein F4803DRAFT_577320 [Xylaria telfairii]
MRIQSAYEILSDDSKRREYDASRRINFPVTGANGGGDDGRDGQYHHEAFLQNLLARQRLAARYFERERKQQEEFERLTREATERQAMDARKRQERQREKREQVAMEARKRQERQREKRERVAREEREAKAAAIDQEALEQQVRWRREGATTEEAKVLTCLHSSFCVKIQQHKKFKCDACGARRGMTTFECPHCARHLCQLCVTQFASKRTFDAA